MSKWILVVSVLFLACAAQAVEDTYWSTPHELYPSQPRWTIDGTNVDGESVYRCFLDAPGHYQCEPADYEDPLVMGCHVLSIASVWICP